MSLVCGIDYSTYAVDVVWLDEDTEWAKWHRYPLEGRDAFERTRYVRVSGLRGLPKVSALWERTIAIGIEEPRGYNSGALYRVQGAILACLPRSVLVQPWLPSVWRKAVGLPGNASKGHVKIWADDSRYQQTYRYNAETGRKTYSEIEVWPQDACDAYCIALATRNALQKEEAA